MSTLAFRVYGIPGAQGSKRHVGHGVMVESSKKVKPWRSDVKAAAEDEIRRFNEQWDTDDWWKPIAGPVQVTLDFAITRPRSHYGTGRNADTVKDCAPYFVTSRAAGDADKLARSTLDALTAAGVIVDDSLVAILTVTKVYVDGASGCAVTIRALGRGAMAA